ncbi:uncharacterized protein LOC110947989 [Acanthochromis polyacanthus]|uniref:uncharacterized protein LOC110947989 n=1 Tax=Acanthochromis polyacanthus TaxID=80966 RepID=UPI000B8EEA55|nr:uncharacterized protein LOC110947989 [Acanthochromis polyacanthus]
MDNIYTSTPNGVHTTLSRVLLLLFLTGLQPALSSQGAQTQPPSSLTVEIVGPNHVTVGVPSSIVCLSSCSQCTYSMSLDGQTAQGHGNELAFTVKSWVEALTVKCTVTDDATTETAEKEKKIRVLAGPANISITGPDLMNPTVSHTYSCHAYCRPSCNYTWRADKGPWIRGQGNVISVMPQEMDNSKSLTCKATNSVSGLYITATRNLAVTTGPSHVQIKGPDVIEIAEQYKFECAAECHPSCRYVSSVDGQTVRGNVIEMSVDEPHKSVTLKCEVQNTASKKTATALKTVQIKGFDNKSTRPGETLVLLLFAFILSAAFAL